jgi:hypothetical protein
MRINVFSGKLTKLHAELLVVSCFEDIRPLQGLAGEVDWLYGGIFSNLLMQNRITGKLGETLLLAAQEKIPIPKILLIGSGPSASYGYSQLNIISKKLFHSINGLNVRECAVELFTLPGQPLDLTLLMEAFLKGMEEKKRNEPFDLTFIVKEGEKARVLQQRIKNGEYLWKDSYSLSSSLT